MKKFIFIFALLFCTENLIAQHISFMGIQLGQSWTVVDRSLRQKGFIKGNNYGSQSLYYYSGQFWNFKNATLNVFVEHGFVTSIVVKSTLNYYPVTNFNNLINSLNKKYGKYDIKKHNYWFIWEVDGGAIDASYDNEQRTVYIFYKDRTNSDYISKHQKRNYNDDL